MDEDNHEKDSNDEDFLDSVVYERAQLTFKDIEESFKKHFKQAKENGQSYFTGNLILPKQGDLTYRKLYAGEWLSTEYAPLGTSFADNEPNLVETGYVTEEYIRERLLFCPKELLEKYYDLKDKLINELKYFELFLRSKNIESSCEIIYSRIIFENKEKPVTEEELVELLKSYSVSFEIKKEDLEELKEFLENLDVGALISSIVETSKSTFDKSFWYLKVLILISN